MDVRRARIVAFMLRRVLLLREQGNEVLVSQDVGQGVDLEGLEHLFMVNAKDRLFWFELPLC
jgi:hypothetical protein